MTHQLIASHFICHYCNQDPGTRSDRPHHWDGFYDAATKYSVCNACRAHHHQVKLQLAAAEGAAPGARTYEEMPLVFPAESKDLIISNISIMNTQLQSIPITHIDVWRNHRTDFNQKKIDELAASIAKYGVIQPIVVRPHKGKKGRYQLICGERRLRASIIAAKTSDLAKVIPANVKDLNDDDALDLQLIENLQREDIHALDEATTFQEMLDTKRYTIADIAAKIGKPETFIVSRLKLNDLIPALKKDFRENHLGIAHATLLARLTPEDQKDAYENAMEGRKGEMNYGSVKDLQDFLQRNVICNLSSAPFRKDDEALVPSAGPCTTCPKRSGANALLFPDIQEKDRCFDRVCFNQKNTAHLMFKVVEVIETEPDVHLIKAYGDLPKSIADLCKSHHVKILSEYSDFYERPKNNKGAVRALWLNGSDAGKFGYIVLNSKNGRNSSSNPTTAEKPTAAAFDQRIADIKAREVRAKELDAEKIHARIKERLLSHKPFTENSADLSEIETAALIILIASHCGYKAQDQIAKLLKLSGRDYRMYKSYVKLSAMPFTEKKRLLAQLARTAISDKLMASNDNPFKDGSATAIHWIACEYFRDIVNSIQHEQNSKAEQRAIRVKKRIAEVAAEKKAFIASKAKKSAPGAKKLASHAKPSSSRKSIKQLVS